MCLCGNIGLLKRVVNILHLLPKAARKIFALVFLLRGNVITLHW